MASNTNEGKINVTMVSVFLQPCGFNHSTMITFISFRMFVSARQSVECIDIVLNTKEYTWHACLAILIVHFKFDRATSP